MKRIDIPTDVLDDTGEGDEIRLPEDTSHYIANVLRMRPGDRVELFDGTGRIATAEVLEAGDEVSVKVVGYAEEERNESPLDVRLFQAIPKGKRWKWLLQKATELGVDEVVPLQTRHTVVKIPDDRLDRKLERWSKIVSSAARQCRRTKTPEVHPQRDVEEALQLADTPLQLVADTGEDSVLLSEALAEHGPTASAVGIWVGPEGGFASEEIEKITELGARTVSLGPRVLRSETAGITAVAMAQAYAGDL